MPNLSTECRQYNANGNAIGAERMLCRAADAMDAKDAVIAEMKQALELVAAVPYGEFLTSGLRAVVDVALALAEQGE